MSALLMPDPDEQRAANIPYTELRKWWGKHVAKTVRLGKRRRPEPGALPLADEEEG